MSYRPQRFSRTTNCKTGRNIVRMARRGAAAAEAAIAIPLFVWILFGMLDLGIAMLRSNALSDAARRAGRIAAIHGAMSPNLSEIMGPESMTMTAADDLPANVQIKSMLPTMNVDDVTIDLNWPDGDNAIGDRIQVDMKYLHKPLVPGLLPWGELNLHASSTNSVVN